jgi:predicted RNase H-like HicB family nuclease
MTMEIPVVMEPLPGGGFQARSADPLGLTAEGDTPDAALRNLRDLVETRKASGVILTSIEIPAAKFGSYLGAGIYRDEPLFDRWRAEIEAYRQQVEDDPDRP